MSLFINIVVGFICGHLGMNKALSELDEKETPTIITYAKGAGYGLLYLLIYDLIFMLLYLLVKP